ncbi:MAG: DUF2189 domain-containing protein [Acetobacteraceae bacterium]|jgi:uncharacterized membrane protein
MLIQSPIAWIGDRLDRAFHTVGSASDEEYWHENRQAGVVTVRRIGLNDLGHALTNGLADFAANRTDVVFLCVIYPLVGLLLARLASGYGVVPLLFPLASGFALVGPLAAIGLNEMSRRREAGVAVNWTDAFGVLRSPSIGPIVGLGLLLIAIFLLWLATAEAIYVLTLGPQPPVSIGAFARDVVTTAAGWTMIGLGVGIGFLFAMLTLAISVVSFPLLLDRDVTMETAIWTSIQAVVANPLPMAVWGLIVAAGLVIGSVPCLLGLVIVMPVLGHATWHLYRRVVR